MPEDDHADSESRAAAWARLIFILNSARTRKRMYFSPVEPTTVQHWLYGLEIGASLAGLELQPDDPRPALERRGLEFTAQSHADQLVGLGLDSEAIVDELIAIAIETWEQAARRLGVALREC